MAKQNQIVIPLPPGIKTTYDISANQGLFNSDNLHLTIERKDYKAPNPIQKKVLQTLGGLNRPAVVNRTTNFYQPEFTCRDPRGAIRYILDDLFATGGNLSTQGITMTYTDCQEPFIVIYDYHRLDTASDRALGYTIRVGVLLVEDLKGSFRGNNGLNYNPGTRFVFTHTHNIVNGQLRSAI